MLQKISLTGRLTSASFSGSTTILTVKVAYHLFTQDVEETETSLIPKMNVYPRANPHPVRSKILSFRNLRLLSQGGSLTANSLLRLVLVKNRFKNS
jgi:hypothetical protein